MRKNIFVSLFCVLPLLGGCSLLGTDTGDRWDAVKEIRQAEEGTKQEYLRAKAAEFTGGKEKPTLAITTMDSAGQPVMVSIDLAPVIRAASGQGNHDTYGVDITTTELPQGPVAESIRAVGGATRDILTTPTAMAFTVGTVIGGALSETGGGGTHISGETITASDSFNRTEVHASGQDNTATVSYRQESQETTGMESEVDVDGER